MNISLNNNAADMTERDIHNARGRNSDIPQSHPSSLGGSTSVRAERDYDESSNSKRSERSSGDSGGLRAEKKKLKGDKEKKTRKKRKVDSESGAVGKNSRNRNNHSYTGDGVYAEEGVASSSRKTSTKKGKKKKDGKFKDKKNNDPDRTDYHGSISPRRLPTLSSRSSDYDDRYQQFGGNSHSSSHQQPTTSGRSKKNKKKVRAAAAAAAMMAESGSSSGGNTGSGYSAARTVVDDMMRQALEEDQYSAVGSVVDTDSSDEEDDDRNILMITSGATSSKPSKRSGGVSATEDNTSLIRLDRNVILSAMRKRLRIEGMKSAGGGNIIDTKSTKRSRNIHIEEEFRVDGKVIHDDEDKTISSGRGGNRKKKRKKGRRVGNRSHREIDQNVEVPNLADDQDGNNDADRNGINVESGSAQFDENMDGEFDGEETSIFGQTAGSSNSTWVECDKCKKWRRLRGVVDARKLPSKWYCSMNKTDPERAKCTAPEEEYETPNTPESATDQRTRKHLRLWVRRLQCNDAYEARLPTMTRKMKKLNASSAKDPYEWVRCCNPSCGKWRSLLKVMDASSVIESAKNGQWFCVLNTWDEKTASCAAPQENLPAIGCPP